MPETLRFVDKGDGTGFNIIAQNVGDPITVHYGTFDATLANATFSETETVSADGTTSVTADVGPYQAVAIQSGSVIGVYHFRVSDDTESTHYRCLHAIRDYVIAMSLPGFPVAERHKVHDRPIFTKKEFEQAVQGLSGGGIDGVHYCPLDETIRPYMTEDEVTYPVLMIRVTNKLGNKPSNDWFKSRQLLTQSIQQTALPAVSEIHDVKILPQHVVSGSPIENINSQALIFNCMTTQCRGIA